MNRRNLVTGILAAPLLGVSKGTWSSGPSNIQNLPRAGEYKLIRYEWKSEWLDLDGQHCTALRIFMKSDWGPTYFVRNAAATHIRRKHCAPSVEQSITIEEKVELQRWAMQKYGVHVDLFS